jgi:hypothetical protein
MQTLLSAEELSMRNAVFEGAHPSEIVRWALEESGLDRIAIASAFQAEGTVVMHLATQIRPEIPILFLETGFQFAETLAFKEQLTESLGLNVVDLVGERTVAQQEALEGLRLYERDPERGGAVRGAVRAGARPHDREDQPGRLVVAPRHLGVPAGQRPAAQPAVRPRVRVDRLRAVHAGAVLG